MYRVKVGLNVENGSIRELNYGFDIFRELFGRLFLRSSRAGCESGNSMIMLNNCSIRALV